MFRFPTRSGIRFALFAAGLLTAGAVAEPLPAERAVRETERWTARTRQPFGERLRGGATGRIRTFSEGNEALFHLVELSGGGFVAVAADDDRPAVLAFSPDGEIPEADDDGPLLALLRGDAAAAAGGGRRALGDNRRLVATDNRIEPSVMSTGIRTASTAGRTSVSDVRVAPLVKSQWGQTKVGNKNVFNYYTPCHWYCGCVATALAQLMRFHEYPSASVAAQTFTCYSNAVSVSLTMKGGIYDWTSMPLVPNSSISDAQRESIGRICYDAGVAMRMQYTSGGSGALTSFAFDPLKSIFGYASAQSYLAGQVESLPESAIRNAILANLDAGYPVMLGISDANHDNGHAILADGSGDADGTLWCHLNMGWSGTSDIWYALPDIPTAQCTFAAVDDVVYNVFPNITGSLVTGRITDENGQPLEGATVAARITYRSGWRNVTINTNVVTSATGIYAVFTPGTVTSTVRLQASYGAASSGTATTSTSACSSPSSLDWQTGQYFTSYSGLSIGNSWGNDLVVTAAAGETPAVSAFEATESGRDDGFSLSFSGTGGARYVVEYRESLTGGSWGIYTNLLLSPAGGAALILPRNPTAPSGFWRVVPEE